MVAPLEDHAWDCIPLWDRRCRLQVEENIPLRHNVDLPLHLVGHVGVDGDLVLAFPVSDGNLASDDVVHLGGSLGLLLRDDDLPGGELLVPPLLRGLGAEVLPLGNGKLLMHPIRLECYGMAKDAEDHGI